MAACDVRGDLGDLLSAALQVADGMEALLGPAWYVSRGQAARVAGRLLTHASADV